MSGSVLLVIAGIWVISQGTAGNALVRLGIIARDGGEGGNDAAPSTPGSDGKSGLGEGGKPGGGSGGGGGGGW